MPTHRRRRHAATSLYAVVVLCAALLSGCASLSEDECLTVDWKELGYTDGTRGAEVDRFDDYRRDCAEYGVTPDFEAWLAGREGGLERFCRADRAYAIGRRGSPFPTVCPEHTVGVLADAWAKGRAWRQQSEAIDALQREFREVERAIEVEETLPEDADRETREAARVRRRALLNELDRITDELDRARSQLDRLEF